MLYYPWCDEDRDLLSNCATYEEHYRSNVKQVVDTNEAKYSVTPDYYNVLQYSEDGPPDSLWAGLAPGNEESRLHSLQEEDEPLTQVDQNDINDNSAILTGESSGPSYLLSQHESAANKEIIPPDVYRQMLRQLNNKQREFIMYHRNWCKGAVAASRNGQDVEPYRVFLSGPGGVGESHVIRLVLVSDTIRILKLSGVFEPDDVIVLLTAPTDVTAFNIGGMTLHSALLLLGWVWFQPLGNDRLTTLRCKLSKLMLLIIDEISMEGSNMLLEVHERLQQTKGVTSDSTTCTFGGVNVLAVDGLYQLPPPIGQPALLDKVTDSYAQLYKSGSLWQDEFTMFELCEIMRQKGEIRFVELLCRMRKAE